MYRIFRDAACVQVWLGYEDPEVVNALQSLVSLANQRYRGSSTRLDCSQHFDALLRHPWMTRAWTVQEISLARRALFRVGTYTAERSAIHEAIDRYRAVFADHERGVEVCRGLGYTASTEEGLLYGSILSDYGPYAKSGLSIYNTPTDHVSLLATLMETWPREAKDPRDKVFAIYGMFTKSITRPDYEKSIAQVYTDVAGVCIERSCNLNLLTCAGIVNRIPDDRAIPGLPSWVPDWRAKTFRHSSLYPATRQQSWSDTYIDFAMSQRWTFPSTFCEVIRPEKWFATNTSNIHSLVYTSFDSPSHCVLRTCGLVLGRLHVASPGPPRKSLKLSPLPVCSAIIVDNEDPISPTTLIQAISPRKSKSLPDHGTIFGNPFCISLLEEMPEYGRNLANSIERHDYQCCKSCEVCVHCGLCDPSNCTEGKDKHTPKQLSDHCTESSHPYCWHCRARRYRRDDLEVINSAIPSVANAGDWVCLLQGCRFPCLLRPVKIPSLVYRSSLISHDDLCNIPTSLLELNDSTYFHFIGILESRQATGLSTEITEKRYDELLERQRFQYKRRKRNVRGHDD